MLPYRRTTPVMSGNTWCSTGTVAGTRFSSALTRSKRVSKIFCGAAASINFD